MFPGPPASTVKTRSCHLTPEYTMSKTQAKATVYVTRPLPKWREKEVFETSFVMF